MHLIFLSHPLQLHPRKYWVRKLNIIIGKKPTDESYLEYINKLDSDLQSYNIHKLVNNI